MKSYLILVFVILSVGVKAQKKLVPATVSEFSSMTLPQGTLQDKRLLSTAAAAVLLEDEAKKAGVKITVAEVLTLPSRNTGWNRNRFEELIRLAGWQMIATDNPQYGWLVRGNEYLFYYYDEVPQRTDLYFGKPDGVPNLPGSGPTQFTSTQPTNQQSVQQTTVTQPPSRSGITGTWYKVSATSGNTAYGYRKCQYTFFSDGTYQFYAKTFDVYTPDIVFRKEKGTFVVSGNLLTLTPTSSVIQTWSKKDNADKYGTLLKAQQGTTESTVYAIRFENFGDELNLLLTPVNGQQTQRDGIFGTNSQFPNTYFYQIPPADSYLVELPEGERPKTTEKKPESQPALNAQTAPANAPRQSASPPSKPSGGYTFSVTNWNDGWLSTANADHVLVTKGQFRVYLHFPRDWSAAKSNENVSYATDSNLKIWEILILPRYQVVSPVKPFVNPMFCYDCIYFFEADAIERASGKSCHVGLRITENYVIELVAPTESDFWKEFQDQDKILNMTGYNKFSVALSDLVGKWSGGGSAAMNYYNAYTGAYAGMSAVAISDEFEFYPDGNYRSTHKGAYGMVGAMNTYQLEYSGKATYSNWEIVLPNRWEGKTETFSVWFEVVMGGRILRLVGKNSVKDYTLIRIKE
ncbi:MAG: lipocalin family protein [Cyclobacteriaceae bacterium]|nr:lipocalin family protein [Cyclobacteriaceae bacterium]